MAKPILWGGLEIGASEEEVIAALPKSRREENGVTSEFELLDCEFKAVLAFDEIGLASVDLHLIRTLVRQRFDDVVQRLIGALASRHGRGAARRKDGVVLEKRWREPYVTIDPIAIDDPEFEAIMVTYKKIAITDAVHRFL